MRWQRWLRPSSATSTPSRQRRRRQLVPRDTLGKRLHQHSARLDNRRGSDTAAQRPAAEPLVADSDTDRTANGVTRCLPIGVSIASTASWATCARYQERYRAVAGLLCRRARRRGGAGRSADHRCAGKRVEHINVGGGPTEDKPTATLEAPSDPDRVASSSIYASRTSKPSTESGQPGVQFLTPPVDRGIELRCYIRDPDVS